MRVRVVVRVSGGEGAGDMSANCSDTAGLREVADPVEEEGVQRALRK